jgi:hypothetical protein
MGPALVDGKLEQHSNEELGKNKLFVTYRT